jgi:small conductance mechanosensitive channel
VPLRTYLASASIIGLAVGFGLQGFVQDVIIGLTLIFSDVINVGDMVDLSGQSGRVERIGLRFTTLVKVLGQEVNVSNRNITQINRYHEGAVRAYVDVQMPASANDGEVRNILRAVAIGTYRQHQAVLLTEPEVSAILSVEPGGWRYVRIKFRTWPGQEPLIEESFKQRVLSEMRSFDSGYADWMVVVTQRAACGVHRGHAGRYRRGPRASAGSIRASP